MMVALREGESLRLPRIGDTLEPGQTLEAMARRARPANPACRRCGEPVLPRGYDPAPCLCWFCLFPRRLAL